MFRVLLPFALLIIPAAVLGDEAVVATRTIRSQTVLALTDLAIGRQDIPGGFTDPAQLVGLEARVVLYAGRPIRPGDVGAPALVTRNQVVPLVYETAGFRIVTEGRVLGRGAEGDRLRVMNLSSRTTVTGTVTAEGSVRVAR